MRTYDEMISGLKELKEKGFVKTHRTGDTGIGKTLEDLLGIEENNIQGPDGEDTELKAARKNSPSMLTLFTKSPLPRGINSMLRAEYGYPDENHPDKMALRTTIDSVDFNTIKGKKGFMIISKGDRIEIVPGRKPKKFPDMENPYWNKEDFENSIKKKYKKSLLYVKAEHRGQGDDEEFHFNAAYLLDGFDFNKFAKSLKEGILKVDIRLGLYSDGRFHDHGTGIRIKPSLLDECFSGKKVL
ncbi:MAG: glycosyl hydrolase [Thaumarchaeota archaeon]|jgi:hypothetical protein|nr:MAG: glycosyl hydrolase [Nitrososphaerota archaeon]